MNPAGFALRKRTFMAVMTVLIFVAGAISYGKLGRLEDPTFLIKTAMVITPYPGASPLEVEKEVTDVVEEAVQSMGQVKEVRSTSKEGLSIVYVDMKDEYKSDSLTQLWDELRKKVGDVRGELPPGAGPSSVNDDFGDVYGVFFALTGKGYSMAQLRHYAEGLKKDLLLCQDVAKVSIWGDSQEVIYVEFKRSRLAELGIPPSRIYDTLSGHNLVEPAGKVKVDGEHIRVSPSGEFQDESSIADLLVGGTGGLVRLGEVATIRRGYQDPPDNIMRFGGEPAVGIGVSTVSGGNVVTMGESIKSALDGMEANRPAGMKLSSLYYQSEIVVESVSAFVLNLVEAVGIVVAVLMAFMGWQSGLLVGFILLLTILCTFCGMFVMDIDLQKISLGALILALGMLVDNAIVVADGILVRVERGEDRENSAVEVVRDTQWPLLGATFVAILAFTAIGFAPGNVGEFCRSLFEVMALSLSLSWILAVTITPLLCVWFLKVPDVGPDPYDKPLFRHYRAVLSGCLSHRWLTIASVLLALVVAVVGFSKVPQAFFPDSTQRRFYFNYWKPQGTHIEETAADVARLEDFASSLKGVKGVASFIGEGTLRFVLSYNYEPRNSSYGQLLIEVEDLKGMGGIMEEIDSYARENFPDAEFHCTRLPNGPGVEYKIGVRFRGPDETVLKGLADQAIGIMRENPLVRDLRTDWRQPVHVLRPQFSESRARQVGVSRHDLLQALQWTYGGTRVGIFREDDDLIPIISRPPEDERTSVGSLEDVQVWSGAYGDFVPLSNVVDGSRLVWEDPLINRHDRQRAISVECNPISGTAETLRQELMGAIESIQIPLGYSMTWIREYQDSAEAQEPLQRTFPLCLIAMFLTVVLLFNSIRKPIIVFLSVPLSLIGVSGGMVLSGIPFGFMSILGFLGLSGMLIKNAIVLIDELEIQIKDGKDRYLAILDSSVVRLRPVVMAAGTTVLGMAPLLFDPMYSGMSVTIMGGLFVGTFLTMIMVPVFYAVFYRIFPLPKTEL